jgi:hypothetical protein
MAKAKGLSHDSIKDADDAAKAEKAAPKEETQREQLKSLKVITAFAKDNELAQVIEQLRARLDEIDTARGDAGGRDRMESGGRNR